MQGESVAAVARIATLVIVAAAIALSPGLFMHASGAAKGLWVALLAGGLGAYLGMQFLFGKLRVDRGMLHVSLALIGLLAWVSLSALGAGGMSNIETVGFAFETGTIGSYAVVCIAFFAGYVLARFGYRRELLTTIAASAGTLAALYVGGLFLGPETPIRLLGEWFSATLAFALAAIVGTHLWISRADSAPWLGVGILLNIVAVAVAGSSALLASVALSLVAIAALSRGARWRMLLVFIAASVCFALAIFPMDIERLGPLKEIRPSLAAEIHVIAHASADPWTFYMGAGPNTFPAVWNANRPIAVNGTSLWDRELASGYSFALDQIVMYGFPFVLALYLLLGGLFARARVFVRSRDDAALAVRGALVAALFATGWLMVYAPHLSFMFVLATLLGTLASLPAEERYRAIRFARPLSIALGVALVMSGVLLSAQAAARLYAVVPYAQALRLLAEDSTAHDRASRLVERSLHAAPLAPALALRSQLQRSEVSSLRSETARLSSHERGEITARIIESIGHAGFATDIDPKNFRYWLELGDGHVDRAIFSGNASYLDDARRAYEEARARAPTHPLPYLHLARLSITEGNTARARDLLRKAIELKPDYQDAWSLYGRLEDSPQ